MCRIGGITGYMAKSFISDDQMRTVWQQRQDRRRIGSLGETVSRLMKKTLSKRVRQLGQIAAPAHGNKRGTVFLYGQC